jgi:hypothetical protein
MSEWQPIETAPKDETAVLAYQRLTSQLWVIAPMYWCGSTWLLVQFHSDNYEHGMQPTHWMEIPEPPKE